MDVTLQSARAAPDIHMAPLPRPNHIPQVAVTDPMVEHYTSCNSNQKKEEKNVTEK